MIRYFGWVYNYEKIRSMIAYGQNGHSHITGTNMEQGREAVTLLYLQRVSLLLTIYEK